MKELFQKLKALDAYPKVNEDFYTRTLSGGVITIASSVCMLLLFLSELSLFLSLRTTHELSVDTSRGEKLEIHIDVVLPYMACDWMGVDVMDISGDVQLEVDHDIYKQRLDKRGKPIDDHAQHQVGPEKNSHLVHQILAENNITAPAGANSTACPSCYGAETEELGCCKTCDDVRKAYRLKGWGIPDLETIEQCQREGLVFRVKDQEGEGCHMWGTLLVNKVAGNFHFAPGKSYQQGGVHVHDLSPFKDIRFDLTHRINKLSFGKPYPGMKNPMDQATIRQQNHANPSGMPGMFQYFLKVVPTVYIDIRNNTISSNQFSVTEHFKGSDAVSQQNLPGIFFFYDLSPIKVRFSEEKSSFLHFLTNVCAIVGGVFTVSGIIDAFVYHGQKVIRKKIELGKFS